MKIRTRDEEEEVQESSDEKVLMKKEMTKKEWCEPTSSNETSTMNK